MRVSYDAETDSMVITLRDDRIKESDEVRPGVDSAARAAAEEGLEEVVRRIVERVSPLQILLFGSRARGDARPHSDFDLLVVAEQMPDKRAALRELRRAINGVSIPVDVVPTSPEEIARRGHINDDVLRLALREGRVVYERG